mmetsp:Transcript_45253/g.127990  ORF Transcript_45253/g.127990 Transcript_45253/m.127990 type:complete len:279 (+) Transcript_45253:192-1028(+)
MLWPASNTSPIRASVHECLIAVEIIAPAGAMKGWVSNCQEAATRTMLCTTSICCRSAARLRASSRTPDIFDRNCLMNSSSSSYSVIRAWHLICICRRWRILCSSFVCSSEYRRTMAFFCHSRLTRAHRLGMPCMSRSFLSAYACFRSCSTLLSRMSFRDALMLSCSAWVPRSAMTSSMSFMASTSTANSMNSCTAGFMALSNSSTCCSVCLRSFSPRMCISRSASVNLFAASATKSFTWAKYSCVCFCALVMPSIRMILRIAPFWDRFTWVISRKSRE